MAHNNKNGSSSFSDEILKLAQCLMPEPPTPELKRLVADSGTDPQVHENGRKAHARRVSHSGFGATMR